MHWPHSRIKILRYFQKCWRLKNLQTYRSRCATNKIEKPKICLSKHNKKKYRKISAILYYWKTADRIEAGFSLKNRSKGAENMSDGHHARSNHRFRDIRLQFTSLRLILKNIFPRVFSMFSTYIFFIIFIKKLFLNND